VSWPRKVDVFGVNISVTHYDEAVAIILRAAAQGQRGIVSAYAVHGLVTASRDPALRAKMNTFDLVTPDGQPVRWAVNLLHGAGLPDRVYGPELMLRLCRAAGLAGVPIYLYGSTPSVVESLQANLGRQFPALTIAGWEPNPHRPLSAAEDRALVARINRSGARLVFIGLGCPRQELFAHEHRDVIEAVQICVGAAFDFHAGIKKMAPPWMQRHGLEWFYRLTQEPGRLWQRYLVTNSLFLYQLGKSLCTSRR
jgi:exopolysaccharide biosynthesis WecB/TagA/CpsF family protein